MRIRQKAAVKEGKFDIKAEARVGARRTFLCK